MNITKFAYAEFPRHPLEGKVLQLHHYLNSHWEDVLRDSRLKLSSVKDFNDLFDCRSMFCDTIIDGQMKEMLQKHYLHEGCCHNCDAAEIAQRYRNFFLEQRPFDKEEILCFSNVETSESDILMWSHYAKKWAGVRLGFDILFENHEHLDYKGTTQYFLTPIRYQEKMPVFPHSAFIGSDNFKVSFCRFFLDVVSSKAKAWKYENEWRLMATTDVSECDGGMRFWRFNRKLLKTIDLGPRMDSDEKRKILILVKCFYPKAIVREAVPDCSFYKINYNQIG